MAITEAQYDTAVNAMRQLMRGDTLQGVRVLAFQQLADVIVASDDGGFPVITEDGAAGTPGFTFQAEQTTGIFRPGASRLGITVGGTQVGEWYANGLKIPVAAARIVPGATSLSLRNNADNADNLIVTDAGAVTIRTSAVIGAPATHITGYTLHVFSGASNNNGMVQVGGTSGTGLQLYYEAVSSGRSVIADVNNGGGANNYITIGFGAITSGVPATSVAKFDQTGVTTLFGALTVNGGINGAQATGLQLLLSNTNADAGDTLQSYIGLQTGGSNRWAFGQGPAGNADGAFDFYSYALSGRAASISKTGTLSVAAGASIGAALLATTDNSYDIGAAGATRFRDLYMSRDVYTNNAAALIRTKATLTSGAGAGAGTITNAPHAGNPDSWLPIDNNGTTYWVPGWHA